MSIADKLIYLNNTKKNLKDSINNIGGSITDETTNLERKILHKNLDNYIR